MINVNSIVKFSSVEAITKAFGAHKISKSTSDLNEYYGIVRDAFQNGYYVEFFNHNSKSLDIAFYETSDLTPCGGLYDLIKNAVAGTQTKARVQAAKKKDKAISKSSSKNEENNTLINSKSTSEQQSKNLRDMKPSEITLEDLQGKRVLFTGKFLYFQNTDNFKQALKDNGMIYQSSVTDKLDVLVMGSRANVGRMRRAEEFGAVIIPEIPFSNLLSK